MRVLLSVPKTQTLRVQSMNSVSEMSMASFGPSSFHWPFEKAMMYSWRGTMWGLDGLFHEPQAQCLAAECLFQMIVPR